MTTKTKTLTVSKLQHRLGRQGISYCCELRVGRTCYASIDQEANGGCERVDFDNPIDYLFIHHWILDTQKNFLKEYDEWWLDYESKQSWFDGNKAKKTQELKEKYILWDKLAKEKPQSWKEARKIQQELGFFDDMVGTWTTMFVEDKVGHKYD